jgi:hypothetical protein
VQRGAWEGDGREVVSQQRPGWTEENHKKPRSGYPVSGTRFETGASDANQERHLIHCKLLRCRGKTKNINIYDN